eukprot:2531468-Pleurochrysis_carterae.AAC.1
MRREVAVQRLSARCATQATKCALPCVRWQGSWAGIEGEIWGEIQREASGWGGVLGEWGSRGILRESALVDGVLLDLRVDGQRAARGRWSAQCDVQDH